ncbi:MAG: hypothetical protein J2P28_23670, partial [Actinobacteria bacterium]|nr:hypothetical protein [Actinomycetota bacterium]
MTGTHERMLARAFRWSATRAATVDAARLGLTAAKQGRARFRQARMGLGTAAREYLPAPAQDLLRSLRDASSPRRRLAARPPAGGDALLARVSPQGRVLAGPFVGMKMVTDAHSSLWGG